MKHHWLASAATSLIAGLIVVAAMSGMLSSPMAAGAQVSPEQELVERFAPVVMLREQEADCDHDGEGYFPAAVDFLFNNPDIKLVANAGGDKEDDPVLLEGFTAQDLVTAGPDTYLDFPGDPRDPGCTYETYFKQMAEELGLEPTTYARIVTDPVSRRLYIQYWFFYFFNHWNNTHESDWEMIQLVFEGTQSVEEALEFGPSAIAFAQHGGGELGRWDEEKLEKQGDRPVVYPSAGSHGSYYGQHNFIGWGENGTAFGCDNTTPPSVETPLNVVLVPEVIDPDSEFAFFLYEGHWGERDVAMFEGPKGPNMGGKWSDPTGAIENWRTSTLKVPDSSLGGVNTTDAFCTLSEWGSKAVIYLGSHPWATGLLIVGVLGLLGFLCSKVWQYLMEALDIYGNELRTFLGIGALVIPIGFAGSLVSEYLFNIPPFEWIDQTFNSSTSGRTALTLVVGSLATLAMFLVVTPAVVYAMKDIRQGIKPGVWRSYRGAINSLGLTAPIVVAFAIVSIVSTLTLVLIPVALYLLVRWMFGFHAGIIDEQRPFMRALGASWETTRGNWLRAFFGSLIFQLLVIVPGPLFGMIVLIFGGSRVGFANFLSSFVYTLTIPLATIGITMLYHRLSGHEIVEPDIVTKELDEALSGGAGTQGMAVNKRG